MASDMSILSKNNSNNMSTPIFREFKKQASFFFKEKIKIARLALTDVTPAELLTEEATDGNPWAPDTRVLGSISKSAFEVDDYWRIVEILHKRFSGFDRKNWRVSYNSVIVLERLLTHGPESVSKEFQGEKYVFAEMGSFQYVDEKGFNWGLAVRRKSERILKLLEMGPLLKQERDHARKVTREIQGFGSFSHRSSSTGVLRESSFETYGRSNSQYNEHGNQDSENQFGGEEDSTQQVERTKKSFHDSGIPRSSKKIDRSISWCSFGHDPVLEKFESETSFKENMAPDEDDEWNYTESTTLLSGEEDEPRRNEMSAGADRPFHEIEDQTSTSLLASRDGILLGY